jgi:hypothetical protein
MYDKYSDGTIVHGAGVLEWCWDKEDALNLIQMMRMDDRFSNLTARATN